MQQRRKCRRVVLAKGKWAYEMQQEGSILRVWQGTVGVQSKSYQEKKVPRDPPPPPHVQVSFDWTCTGII